MTYLERLADTRLKFSNSRLNKRDGKAWDNRKKKGAKRYDPRGSVIKRLRAIERTAWWNNTCDEFEKLDSRFKELRA